MPKFDYVKSYVDYWAKRREIKQRQRDELERELLPYAITLGEALAEARETTNIDDLAATLGRSGKNFIYDMIRTYRANIGKPLPEPPTKRSQPTTPEPTPEPDNPQFLIVTVEDNSYWVVEIDTDTYDIRVDANDKLITPEEWMTHSKERRLIYKEIISDIERNREASVRV